MNTVIRKDKLEEMDRYQQKGKTVEAAIIEGELVIEYLLIMTMVWELKWLGSKLTVAGRRAVRSGQSPVASKVPQNTTATPNAAPDTMSKTGTLVNQTRQINNKLTVDELIKTQGKGSSLETICKEFPLPNDALNKFPKDWQALPADKGIGYRFHTGKPAHVGVRIDKGNLRNSQVIQQSDHVSITSNGQKIGRNGKPISGSIKDDPFNAHIPLTEWRKWKSWNQP